MDRLNRTFIVASWFSSMIVFFSDEEFFSKKYLFMVDSIREKIFMCFSDSI